MVGKYRKYERKRIEENIGWFMSWRFDRSPLEQAAYLLYSFTCRLIDIFGPKEMN